MCAAGSADVDAGAVAHASGSESDTFELGLRFDLHRIDLQAEPRGFAIKIVAVAGGQRQHQELAPIDG